MRLPRECYQMQQVIETHLPHLTQSQLTGLVLWVCGAILAGSACQNAVASALSTRGNWNSLRQYLREWLYDGGDRARPCQTELDVSLCFAPLLRWVLVWWRSGRLALDVDPTAQRRPNHRHRHQRGLPGLRHSRLAHPPGHSARVLDGPHGGTAHGTGPSGSPGNDRHRALRPGHSQSQAVATDTRPGWHPYMRYRKNVSFCAQDGRRLPVQLVQAIRPIRSARRGTSLDHPH